MKRSEMRNLYQKRIIANWNMMNLKKIKLKYFVDCGVSRAVRCGQRHTKYVAPNGALFKTNNFCYPYLVPMGH